MLRSNRRLGVLLTCLLLTFPLLAAEPAGAGAVYQFVDENGTLILELPDGGTRKVAAGDVYRIG